jgi:ribosomal protein L12E/L44/L45/RPP1/RPP2
MKPGPGVANDNAEGGDIVETVPSNESPEEHAERRRNFIQALSDLIINNVLRAEAAARLAVPVASGKRAHGALKKTHGEAKPPARNPRSVVLATLKRGTPGRVP